MKRAFFALVMLIGIIGCSKSEYKIDGSITLLKDGGTVSLGYSPDGKNITIVENTTVKNGKFEFSGEVDKCKRYYIVYSDTVKIPFFLEEGTINISITENDVSIYGTHNNDLNTQLKTSLLKSTSDIRNRLECIENDTTLTTEEKQNLSAEIETIRTMALRNVKQFIVGNIESMAALPALCNYAYLFDDNELENIIRKIPPENIDRENNEYYSVLEEILFRRKNPKQEMGD